MSRKKYSKKPAKQVEMAKRRIMFLFREAKYHFNQEPVLSEKYIKLARRIAMKYKIKLPSEIKKRFCKHCNSYLVPGNNCRVRIHKHRVIYYCAKCKNYSRHPIK